MGKDEESLSLFGSLNWSFTILMRDMISHEDVECREEACEL